MAEITITPGQSLPSSYGPFTAWKTNLEKSLALQDDQSHKFNKDPYKLEKINVKATTIFPKGAGFCFLDATIKNKAGKTLPAGGMLRGHSVVMMIVVQPNDAQDEKEQHVLMTVQPRPMAGSLAFAEFPAGMVDGNMTFGAAAMKEIMEETHLKIEEGDLVVNMSEAALKAKKPAAHAWKAHNNKSTPTSDEEFTNGFYLTPGGCDESMHAFYALKKLAREDFDNLNGKETGVAAENEQITLKLVPLADAFFECQRDAKSLVALTLYENLKKRNLLK